MRWLTLIIVLCWVNAILAQKPELRRACPNGPNNTLYWTNPNDTCNLFLYYIIWERKGNTGLFTPIDTIFNKNTETFIHLNATPPLSEPTSYYFIEKRDSCGPEYNWYSDTVLVDVIPPNITNLDSVSVDINTNQVILGWSKNSSPDFDKYLLYVFKNGFFSAMTPSETRDTFARDLSGNNPSTGSFTYNINTRDSCGKLPAYEKRNSTVFLQQTADTCNKTIRLSWSHYEGWNNIVKYYILINTNNSGYNLVDSVIGTISTYTYNYITGNNYQIFVRAIKDTTILVSSSSNKLVFNARGRQEPTYLNIDYITSGIPVDNNLYFQFSTNPADEVSKYEAHILDENLNLTSTLLLSKTDISKRINLGLIDNSKYHLTISSYDVCNKVSFQSDTSSNIILTGTEANSVRDLSWSPYFTWNSGVKEYVINRGTGDNGVFTFNMWNTTNDTLIKDSSIVQTVLNEGICYYVQAVNNTDNTIVSNSNRICLSAYFTVFIPNAFKPDGFNSRFRPEGSLIDYQKSTIKVYNRWGQLIYENNILNGWNGMDATGTICQQGVYYYYLEIFSTKDEKQVKQGIFTLLR